MQSTPADSGSSSRGGSQLSLGGLSRFRSAPATWLEALLEDDDEDSLKPNQCLTELLTADSNELTAGRNSFPFPNPEDRRFQQPGFQRQNSSPADFLGGDGVGADGYLSNFGIPASYDYLSPNDDVSPKGEQRGQVPTGVSGVTDMNMENLLEDSVPCRVRAKRGFATHPRSIAERVRRTRISDRIRILQELVPNMGKQTNTADMLEEAVEYVKSLQTQIQELREQEKRCTCRPKD